MACNERQLKAQNIQLVLHVTEFVPREMVLRKKDSLTIYAIIITTKVDISRIFHMGVLTYQIIVTMTS